MVEVFTHQLHFIALKDNFSVWKSLIQSQKHHDLKTEKLNAIIEYHVYKKQGF